MGHVSSVDVAYKHRRETTNASHKGFSNEVDTASQSKAREKAVIDDDTEDTDVGLGGLFHYLGMRL